MLGVIVMELEMKQNDEQNRSCIFEKGLSVLQKELEVNKTCLE